MEWLGHHTRSACGFIRRHKKMVIVSSVAITITASYFAVKKVLKEAEKFSQEVTSQWAAQQNMGNHMLRSKEECELAVLRFLSPIKNELNTRIPLEECILVLKQLKMEDPLSCREERNVLWEKVKVMGLLRFYTSMYSFVMIHLLIHIQLHILGRRTLEKENIPSQKVQHEYLSSTMEYIVQYGIGTLVQHIQDILSDDNDMSKWKVHECPTVDRDHFFEWLTSLHVKMIPKEDDKSTEKWKNMIMLQIPKDIDDDLLGLLDETWAVFKSPDFHIVLQDALNMAFYTMCEQVSTSIFTPLSIGEGEEEKKMVVFASPPLAKVLPKMKQESGLLLKMSKGSGAGGNMPVTFCQVLTSQPSFSNMCSAIFMRNQQREE